MFALLWPTLATVLAASVLAASLPKLDLPWLALPACAGLLWSWRRRKWQQSALLGFISGMVYFSIAYRWFGESAGALIGWFAPILVLGPALLSSWTFAVAALGQWAARKLLPSPLVPIAAALAFAIPEAFRSIGPLANPFAALAYPQVGTPLGTLAAYVGAQGVTFVVVYLGALLCDLLDKPTKARGPLIGIAVVAVAVVFANLFAPARVVAPPTTPVAIIQGNIRQELKWKDGALEVAVDRYVGLTRSIDSDTQLDLTHPSFVVWPETVIPTNLAAEPKLQEDFRKLAASLDTTLVVGALEYEGPTPYNTLWFIDRSGVARIYRKRELVPFAETLPAAGLLQDIPLTRYISRFGAGTEASVIPIGDHRLAPLICWESEFPALLEEQVKHGADVFILSTDDAWFGESAGPYQHAQIAQLRAIETGRWIVRSAATGISGIIAPNGHFTERSVIDTIAIVRGRVGSAVDTPFNHIGSTRVLVVMIVLYTAMIAVFGLRRAREPRSI